ncbi:MAG: PIN/TRAM domain-containing protein [Synechococcales cyanobacterium RM1_1_8]|nr:PIN/TRAM domain-containing protein [Synechococcales cyanobacterium RM1_1_8]
MLDAVIVISFILAGAGIGFYGIDYLPDSVLLQVSNVEGLRFVTAGFAALLSWALGLLAQGYYRRVQAQVKALPADLLISRAAGLVIGLLIANLMLAPVLLLPIPSEFSFIKPITAVISALLFGVTGVSLADAHGRSLIRLFNPNAGSDLLSGDRVDRAICKIVDTSCIIDGRIQALLETRFLEGKLIVPQFVLLELQQVADSSSSQKRARGRQGLDMLNRLRLEYPDQIIINSRDYPDIATVDAKLVRLAQDLDGLLLTNDFNLSGVAQVQGVDVLNVNQLSKALRPSYLPGDNLNLKILKRGKEPTQGIGYLDDGTMVVVEEGQNRIGDELDVVVTGALQTSAGRMIFAKPDEVAIA